MNRGLATPVFSIELLFVLIIRFSYFAPRLCGPLCRGCWMTVARAAAAAAAAAALLRLLCERECDCDLRRTAAG